MYDSPLFWENGVFLQPQHFQLQHLQALRGTASALGLIHPHLWGIRRLAVNEAALDNGVFEIVSLELLLPTGEWLSVPGNATVAARAFREVWSNPEEPLMIYLGLGAFLEQGGNVVRTDDAATASERSRFTAPLAPDLIPDLYGDGPAVQIQTLRYNLRLCLGRDEGQDLWKLPVARLVRNGERVSLDARFAPPCVDINAVPSLHRLVRDVRDSLLSRSRQLEEYKIVTGDAEVSGVSSLHGMTLFSILGVLCRNAPEFEQILAAPSIHPWPVYRSLCRLVGELSVFSASLSPLGETPQGVRVLPVYQHEQLFECFSAAAAIISRLVDALVIGPAYTFVLEALESPHLLKTIMPQSARSNSYAYWLLLRTADSAGLARQVQALGKLAPTAEIGSIMGQALPGIRLHHREQPPAGLPRRGDTLYFSIDQNDALWQKIMQSGEITFMLPNPPDDLLVQLTVIER